jgi:quercetin dioxygenase-like cupin family protein
MKVFSLKSLPFEGVSHNKEIKKQLMIRDGEIPYLKTFGRVFFKKGQEATAHKHTDINEIFLVLAGQAVFIIDNKEIKLGEGEGVSVMAGEEHQITNREEDTLLMVYFILDAC